jgi:hypothetical protein
MMNNYFSVTSRLYSLFIPVLDVNLVLPNVQIQESRKENFLVVFFFFMALPNAMKVVVEKIANHFYFQIISLTHLLKSTAFEGRGGGGGHGGFAMEEIICPSYFSLRRANIYN